MHFHRIASAYEIRIPAAALEEPFSLLLRNSCEHRRIVDFVSVQVQNRKNRTVVFCAQKLVGMPSGRKRSGFGLAVSDNTGGNQVRIVKNRAESVCQRIAEFSALVDGARSLRCHMA